MTTTAFDDQFAVCTPEEGAEWALKERQLDSTKSWGGHDDGLPPIHSVVEIAESSEHMKISDPAGTQVKIYSHFTDDRGVKLAAYVCPNGLVGGVAIAKAFRPARTPEQCAEDEAVHAMRSQDCEPYEGMLSRQDFCRAIYAAIRAGRIPGVVLGGGHE